MFYEGLDIEAQIWMHFDEQGLLDRPVLRGVGHQSAEAVKLFFLFTSNR